MADYTNASRPRRMLTYNLPLDVEPGSEVTVKQEARDPATGDVKYKRSKKVIPQSLRVPWGHSVMLTEKHLAVPEIMADVKAGELKELKAPKARVETAPPAAPQADEAAPPKKDKGKGK